MGLESGQGVSQCLSQRMQLCHRVWCSFNLSAVPQTQREHHGVVLIHIRLIQHICNLHFIKYLLLSNCVNLFDGAVSTRILPNGAAIAFYGCGSPFFKIYAVEIAQSRSWLLYIIWNITSRFLQAYLLLVLYEINLAIWVPDTDRGALFLVRGWCRYRNAKYLSFAACSSPALCALVHTLSCWTFLL